MRIVMDRRGTVEGTESMDAKRVMLHCRLPLNEILIDFHDTLKSVSHGYASMDYEPDTSPTATRRATSCAWTCS